MADAFVTIGLDGQAQPARVPALLARVVQLHERTIAWSRRQCDRSGDLAAVIGEVVDVGAAARSLAELGAQAHGTGSREICATLLRQTVDIVKAITSGGALKLADRVRLVEILAGPEEAWAMLQREA